jgi:alpha-D-ribose 1-methylphosphonate 5-triphosphate diphosphatase
MSTFIFTNARVVREQETLLGSLHVVDGVVSDISAQTDQDVPVLDLEGDWLLPGLVEMHTDNLEKHLVPRPGVIWPSALAAVLAHDAQLLAAGITTVFDSVSVGEFDVKSPRRQIFETTLTALSTARAKNLLRIEHFLHLRCEVPDRRVVEMFENRVNDPSLRLVSFMDHTPGQRQWTDLDKYRLYHRDKQWTDAELAENVAQRRDWQARHSAANRQRLLDSCRPLGLPLASHDDTLPEHAEEGFNLGMGISEFPTTMAAAARAKELGLTVIMGAPNVVRGQSHSGNASALDMAKAGLLDGLSSDYMPASLLHGAFTLRDKLGLPMHRAVGLVSGNIARAVGLDDRGRIEVGKRADLIRVREVDGAPLVLGVWRQGQRML